MTARKTLSQTLNKKHGYIENFAKSGQIEKIFWVICFLFVIGTTLYESYLLADRYLNDSIGTTISFVSTTDAIQLSENLKVVYCPDDWLHYATAQQLGLTDAEINTLQWMVKNWPDGSLPNLIKNYNTNLFQTLTASLNATDTSVANYSQFMKRTINDSNNAALFIFDRAPTILKSNQAAIELLECTKQIVVAGANSAIGSTLAHYIFVSLTPTHQWYRYVKAPDQYIRQAVQGNCSKLLNGASINAYVQTMFTTFTNAIQYFNLENQLSAYKAYFNATINSYKYFPFNTNWTQLALSVSQNMVQDTWQYSVENRYIRYGRVCYQVKYVASDARNTSKTGELRFEFVHNDTDTRNGSVQWVIQQIEDYMNGKYPNNQSITNAQFQEWQYGLTYPRKSGIKKPGDYLATTVLISPYTGSAIINTGRFSYQNSFLKLNPSWSLYDSSNEVTDQVSYDSVTHLKRISRDRKHQCTNDTLKLDPNIKYPYHFNHDKCLTECVDQVYYRKRYNCSIFAIQNGTIDQNLCPNHDSIVQSQNDQMSSVMAVISGQEQNTDDTYNNDLQACRRDCNQEIPCEEWNFELPELQLASQYTQSADGLQISRKTVKQWADELRANNVWKHIVLVSANQIQVIQEIQIVTLPVLLSNIGGIAGVLTGVSCISLISFLLQMYNGLLRATCTSKQDDTHLYDESPQQNGKASVGESTT